MSAARFRREDQRPDSSGIETLARLGSSGRLDLGRSISEIIPFEDIAAGIRKLNSHGGNPIRILVKP